MTEREPLWKLSTESLMEARSRAFIPPLICWRCGAHRWTWEGFVRHMGRHQELKIVERSGTEQERKMARTILVNREKSARCLGKNES